MPNESSQMQVFSYQYKTKLRIKTVKKDYCAVKKNKSAFILLETSLDNRQILSV